MPVIKRFDFFRDTEPLMNLTLPDGKTILDIYACSKGEYEKVVHHLLPLTKLDENDVSEAEEKRILAELYDVAAELISHNTANKAVTAADLRGTYNVTPEQLINFYYYYAAFCEEIHSLKK